MPEREREYLKPVRFLHSYVRFMHVIQKPILPLCFKPLRIAPERKELFSGSRPRALAWAVLWNYAYCSLAEGSLASDNCAEYLVGSRFGGESRSDARAARTDAGRAGSRQYGGALAGRLIGNDVPHPKLL